METDTGTPTSRERAMLGPVLRWIIARTEDGADAVGG